MLSTLLWTTEILSFIACSSADVTKSEELVDESDSGPEFLSIPAIKSINIITKSSK